MTIRELYDFATEKGTELDPRGPEGIASDLAAVRAEYEALDEKGRLLFEEERLRNPFGDTRILCGDPGTVVRRLVCGIDIAGAEVLMADRMRDHGRPVDVVVGHHTSAFGGALASKLDTMWPQVKMLTDFGVPRHKAEKLIRANAEGEQRNFGYQTNQLAEALGMPLVGIHSPADAFLFHEGVGILREVQPRTVGDLVDICDSWPEVKWMIARGQGTQVAVGDRRDPLGKVYPVLYGGWNPTPEVFEAICEAGCGALWVVATSAELNEVARKNQASIVVIPHGPADARGLNGLFRAAMERFGAFEVVACSNYVWVAG